MYDSQKKAENVDYIENVIGTEIINTVQCYDSRNMDVIPDSSVHLMITSPPYNASKVYDQDLSLEDYLLLLKDVFQETYRVLVPGGRACINIANLGRKPYIPLHSYIIRDMLQIGYLMRGEIIWNKSTTGGSCAWGSWKSASNPTLRDIHEYIMIFSKQKYTRPSKNKVNTISKSQFMEYTQSIWTFPPESARKIGHPAPFPEELPHRLIQLYSYENDVVLDPFAGSGTTCVSALKDDRNFIGFDISKEYVEMANSRLKDVVHFKSIPKLSEFVVQKTAEHGT